MLTVIFNQDGSIKALVVGESIQQGNNNVNHIFATILGVDVANYTCVAEFVLPNGDLVELSGVSDSEEIGDTEYDGYKVSLSEAVTLYPGELKVNLKLLDLNNHVLCTYQIVLKVNPTGYEPNETNITEAQYNALLSSLNSYVLKTDYDNLIATLQEKGILD